MDTEHLRERYVAGALFAAGALLLVGWFAGLASSDTRPRAPAAPVVISKPAEPFGAAAALENRRGKLILRAETEAKTVPPSKDVITMRQAAFRIEEGILRSKSEAELDQWERRLDSHHSRAPSPSPDKS